MKAMAIDLGARRVGIAVNAEGTTIALPLVTLTRERKTSDRLRRITRLGEEHQCTCFVVGLPLQMDGSEGEGAKNARIFAERLRERSGKDVHLVDERLTSVEAEESMLKMGASRERRKELVDQMAAVIILQSFMERQR